MRSSSRRYYWRRGETPMHEPCDKCGTMVEFFPWETWDRHGNEKLHPDIVMEILNGRVVRVSQPRVNGHLILLGIAIGVAIGSVIGALF